MTKTDTLEWMIRESVSGNTTAFQMLFESTKNDVFRFIRYRVNSREEALDLLQDAYFELWKSMKKGRFTYSSIGEFFGFLYLIVRRKVAKTYEADVVLSLDEIDDVSGEEVNKSNYLELLNSLNKLSLAEREIVELRYFSDLSFREIADLVNRGENAVRVSHHRAMAKLREILGYEEE